MTIVRISALVAALSLALAAPAIASSTKASAVMIGTYSSPTYITTAPGQNELLFVVEQAGVIHVLDNEVDTGTPFLDISSLVLCCDERGLLSMAFAPDYASSGLFYVAYTGQTGDVEIEEFKRQGSSATATVALPGSRRHLLSVRHRGAGNHNGGQLQFGPDGFLYISIGDGGELTPRGDFARKLSSDLGKILRINPKAHGGKPYQIPSGNPFMGANQNHEIFAYGFRNPWRFSFDGNRIIIADVGQSAEEEINFLTIGHAIGRNFGWPQYEGKLIYDNSRPGPGPVTFPMFVYTHDNGGCAVIGGYVIHDPLLPDLDGRYIYGDLCTGDLRTFLADVDNQKAGPSYQVGISVPNLTTFGRGPNSTIYFARTSGEVYRLGPPPP